ncbi:helix-turn-helix domain-containing protein [Fibrella sp. HMF5335]|uniref:Helix-turn-helix domain-containing protein n=1 Tax=Fibrella rubiginis TaxID=2817060 RepID=A0A939GKK1_9BACT|nr:helix-turn-helix domain-containing protein [Fibrella rubiginis]
MGKEVNLTLTIDGNALCHALNCQPGDLLAHVPEGAVKV